MIIIIAHLIANMLGIWLASFLVPDFIFTGTIKALALTAALLTAINLLIKPIVKFILAPFIILTFGFLILLINAGMLYVVDFFSEQLTVTGFWPLFWGTVIISLINFIFTRRPKSKPAPPPPSPSN